MKEVPKELLFEVFVQRRRARKDIQRPALKASPTVLRVETLKQDFVEMDFSTNPRSLPLRFHRPCRDSFSTLPSHVNSPQIAFPMSHSSQKPMQEWERKQSLQQHPKKDRNGKARMQVEGNPKYPTIRILPQQHTLRLQSNKKSMQCVDTRFTEERMAQPTTFHTVPKSVSDCVMGKPITQISTTPLPSAMCYISNVTWGRNQWLLSPMRGIAKTEVHIQKGYQYVSQSPSLLSPSVSKYRSPTPLVPAQEDKGIDASTTKALLSKQLDKPLLAATIQSWLSSSPSQQSFFNKLLAVNAMPIAGAGRILAKQGPHKGKEPSSSRSTPTQHKSRSPASETKKQTNSVQPSNSKKPHQHKDNQPLTCKQLPRVYYRLRTARSTTASELNSVSCCSIGVGTEASAPLATKKVRWDTVKSKAVITIPSIRLSHCGPTTLKSNPGSVAALHPRRSLSTVRDNAATSHP